MHTSEDSSRYLHIDPTTNCCYYSLLAWHSDEQASLGHGVSSRTYLYIRIRVLAQDSFRTNDPNTTTRTEHDFLR